MDKEKKRLMRAQTDYDLAREMWIRVKTDTSEKRVTFYRMLKAMEERDKWYSLYLLRCEDSTQHAL